MSTSFNTLKVCEVLKASGFSEAQARSLAEALQEIYDNNTKNLATKTDLLLLEMSLEGKLITTKAELEAKIAKLKADLNRKIRRLNWMAAITLVGALTLVVKTFFLT